MDCPQRKTFLRHKFIDALDRQLLAIDPESRKTTGLGKVIGCVVCTPFFKGTEKAGAGQRLLRFLSGCRVRGAKDYRIP